MLQPQSHTTRSNAQWGFIDGHILALLSHFGCQVYLRNEGSGFETVFCVVWFGLVWFGLFIDVTIDRLPSKNGATYGVRHIYIQLLRHLSRCFPR